MALSITQGIPEKLDSGRMVGTVVLLILDAWTLEAWTLNVWTLEAWTLGLWTIGLWTLGLWTLGLWTPERLDAWTPGRLDAWTFGLWTPGRLDASTLDSGCMNSGQLGTWITLRNSKDHAYSIEGISFNVAIFRNSILTLSVTLQKNTERNFYCEKLNYITSSYLRLSRSNLLGLSIFKNLSRKYRSYLESLFWQITD